MPPAPKRQKLFRACEACVASKTRCEDVTPDGCGHCRRRRRPCSLQALVGAYAPATPAEERYPTPTSEREREREADDVRVLRARLAESEARLANLERRPPPYTSPAAAGPSTPRRGHDREARPEGPDRLVAGALHLGTMYHRVIHDETLFTPSSTRPYRKPTSAGLSADQVELAWHQFKARITALLPLPPFAAVSTPVPEHGFVQTAMLQFVPSLASGLKDLVDESVLLAMSGHASQDVVLALLILSLAPAQPDNRADVPAQAPVTPSAFRLVALAYSMGANLGMQSTAEAALRADLDSEHWADMRWQLLLWAAVVNRYSLLSLMFGKSVTLPPLVAPRLPTSARESVEACHAHLRAEGAVVSAFLPLAAWLNDLEHALSYDATEVAGLQTVWKAAFDAAAPYVVGEGGESAFSQMGVNAPHAGTAVRRPAPRGPGAPGARAEGVSQAVRNDARLIQFVLGVRIASLSMWIPSPLIEAREAALRALNGFPSVMSAVIDILGDCDPKRLPAYTCMFIAVATLCLRRAVLFVQYTYNHQLIDSRKLDQAEEVLRPVNAGCRFLFHHAGELFRTLPYGNGLWGGGSADACDGERGEQVRTEMPSFGVDLEILNWDLSLLYPDLNSFPTTMSM